MQARVDFRAASNDARQVLHGMVAEARARFELENHAHDLYDAFQATGGRWGKLHQHVCDCLRAVTVSVFFLQAIHAGLVRKSTFFHLDEMIRLIESAHHVKGVRGVSGVSGEHRPEMGHKVLVSNLWEVRDIWNWLAPGWSDPSTKEEARPGAKTH